MAIQSHIMSSLLPLLWLIAVRVLHRLAGLFFRQVLMLDTDIGFLWALLTSRMRELIMGLVALWPMTIKSHIVVWNDLKIKTKQRRMKRRVQTQTG